jgi:polysaccharide export outer membrane protein
MTREEAAKAVKTALSKFYEGLAVTVRVDQYVANKVVIIGRVKTPGVQRFDNIPTLLEAISRAGGLAEDAAQHHNLSHVAVVRGRDRVAWLDLRNLLEAGDLSLNLRLKRNDVVIIPDFWDQPVYVLGQVVKPGPIRWMPGMSYVDALALAGGATRDAATYNIVLIRPSKNLRINIPQSSLLDPTLGTNVSVERGDILFVPSSLLADLGYVFEKLNPFGWVFLAQAVK